MKTWLLTAKYLVIRTDKLNIEKSDLIEAMKYVELLEPSMLDKVKALLPDASFATEYSITPHMLEEASQAPRIDFSAEMKQLLEQLQLLGMGTDKKVTKLYEKAFSPSDGIEKIRHLKKALAAEAFGQHLAIESISDGLMRAQYKQKGDKPHAVFLFAGPISPAKMHVCKKMGQLLPEYSLETFKMSTYNSSNGSMQLFGTPNPYAGAGEGVLTEYIAKHPKSIIIIEDLELSGAETLVFFSKMINEGNIQDAYNQKNVDCTQIILIFTTAMGKEVYAKHEFLQIAQNDQKQAEMMILDALSRETYTASGTEARYSQQETPIFTPQFMSGLRQANIVLFGKIGFSVYVEFIKQELLKEFENFKTTMGITLNAAQIDDLAAMMVLSSGPDFDLESIKVKTPASILDLITDTMIKSDHFSDQITLHIDDASVEFITQLVQSQDDMNLLHTLFRKSLTLKYHVSYDTQSQTIHFQNTELSKVKKAKDYGEEGGFSIELPDISFSDIAGHHKVKERLQEAIRILKDGTLGKEIGKYMPKGMLLYGPPGTGKTMLAKAFANEADLPFIATTGPDMLDESMMKKVFDKARDYAPSIVFIDEIDVFKHRGLGYGTDMLINKLLTLIDGFSTKDEERVFVIAATNLKDQIDDAILRSGRIDLHVLVDYLDRDARAWFIDRMLKKPMFEPTIEREKLLKYTANMSGADLQKIESESILYFRRKGFDKVSEQIVIELINTLKYGEKIEDDKLDALIERTAYHESGHAVISKVLFPQQKIEQITVAPRKDSLGFVSYDNEGEYQNHTRAWYQNKMCVSLAGRAAEMKQYAHEGVDEGASSDLFKVNRHAYIAIAELGMDDRLPNIRKSAWGENNRLFDTKIEELIGEWIREQTSRTDWLINEHWAKIETIAKLLIEKEVIEEDEMDKLFDKTD